MFGLMLKSTHYAELARQRRERTRLEASIEQLRSTLDKQDNVLSVTRRNLTNAHEELEATKVQVANQAKTILDRRMGMINHLQACINNTNDKLRHFGQAAVDLNSLWNRRPEGKVSPKVREEWKLNMDAAFQTLRERGITQVIMVSDLPKSEADEPSDG